MQPAEMHSHAHLRPSVWVRRLSLGRLVLTLSVQPERAAKKPEPVHNRLTALRQERGLTDEELAEQLQIHPTTLQAMEQGEYVPSLRLALRLSAFFGLPIETIFFTPTDRPEQAEADLLAGYPHHEALTAREESHVTGV